MSSRLLDLSPKEIKKIKERLVEALSAGVSIKSSCTYAQITEEEYEVFVRMNPEIADLHERCESMLGTQAIINVANDIKKGNVRTSKWFLDRTDERFNPKSKVSMDGTPVLVPVEQKEEEISKLLERFGAPEGFNEDGE